jgi:hypothetical protein
MLDLNVFESHASEVLGRLSVTHGKVGLLTRRGSLSKRSQ